jgi:hypothetical protein
VLTVADAGLVYMNRPGGLKSYDLWRLDQINDVVGDYPIAKAAEGWGRFKQVRCIGLAPATVERFRGRVSGRPQLCCGCRTVRSPKAWPDRTDP